MRCSLAATSMSSIAAMIPPTIAARTARILRAFRASQRRTAKPTIGIKLLGGWCAPCRTEIARRGFAGRLTPIAGAGDDSDGGKQEHSALSRSLTHRSLPSKPPRRSLSAMSARAKAQRPGADRDGSGVPARTAPAETEVRPVGARPPALILGWGNAGSSVAQRRTGSLAAKPLRRWRALQDSNLRPSA
jgi:hypothetical protein